MALYVTTFYVDGNGRFPLDMLRYDSCFPRDGDAVGEIDRRLDPRHDRSESHPIKLAHYGSSALWQPTVGRWLSFGWGVDRIHTSKV